MDRSPRTIAYDLRDFAEEAAADEMTPETQVSGAGTQ
jgi:hypothetical protein